MAKGSFGVSIVFHRKDLQVEEYWLGVMDATKTKEFVYQKWDSSIIGQLEEYIRIPNQSPDWDKNWRENGHAQRAIDLMVNWVKEQQIPNLSVEVVSEGTRTPIIFIQHPASESLKDSKSVLMYGHMDKQPPLTDEWEEGLGPYTPVIRDGKLYGRGGADDGYAIFAAVTALGAALSQNIPLPAVTIVIEASEESSSVDLPYYMSKLSSRIGAVELIICLDSGCGNYEQFWLTTSLRGIADGNLTVQLLSEGVHSGDGSGVIPDSFRITRLLLDRLEDAATGKVKLPEAYGDIPAARLSQAERAAEYLGDHTYRKFPLLEGVAPTDSRPVELILNRTWRPQLTVVGAQGLPPVATAGNVLRRSTSLRLSLRLPPTANAAKAEVGMKELLEKDPPYNAHVTFEMGGDPANGWTSPLLAEWLEQSLDRASLAFYGKPSVQMGEGGSIPFMGMLGEQYPQAQFVITGVLGPNSNAHGTPHILSSLGPNEFLHLLMGKNVTCCVAHILGDFAAQLKK